MEFEFNESQALILESVRRYLNETMTLEAKLDADESTEGYSLAVWDECTELGWLGACCALDGDEVLTLGIIAQEIGRHALASPFLVTTYAAILLSRVGGLSDTLTLAVSEGNCVLSMIPEEAFKDMNVRGEPDGSVFIESGSAVVEWGSAAKQWAAIVSLPDGESRVLLINPDTPGVQVRASKSSDAGRLSVASFDEVSIPAHCVFSPSGSKIEESLGLVHLLSAAEALGGAEGALQLTVDYVREREQFGHSLARFQAIRHGLADTKILTDAAWLAVWEGIGKAANGEHLGGSPGLAMMAAKRAFQDAALKGSQYHGGMGHTVDSHMQFFYRRAGTYHGRCPSEWRLLGEIADAYVNPILENEYAVN